MNPLNLISIILLLLFTSCGGGEKKKELTTSTAIELTEEYLEKGAEIYRAKCMNCHMKSGKGIIKFYPPLADSDYLRKNTRDAIHMVKFGSNKPIKVNGVKYNSLMPASGLTDKELVIVFNYILNSWGNDYGTVSLEEVEAIKR